MEVEGEQTVFEIIDFEKKAETMKNKITLDELDSLLERMRNLNTRIDFDSQIEFLVNSKKN